MLCLSTRVSLLTPRLQCMHQFEEITREHTREMDLYKDGDPKLHHLEQEKEFWRGNFEMVLNLEHDVSNGVSTS